MCLWIGVDKYNNGFKQNFEVNMYFKVAILAWNIWEESSAFHI